MSASSLSRRRAACYYRCSTTIQEMSVERQKSQVLPYAQRRGYEVVGEYADEGLSGLDVTGGDGFKKVMALASAKKIDVIVIDEPSRLSREDTISFMEHVVIP